MPSIVPSVGRKVWYFASGAQPFPIDATVIKVMGDKPDSPVNLSAIDPDTGQHTMQPGIVVGDESTEGEHYRWMPFQQVQAAKAANEVARASEPTTKPAAAPAKKASRKR